MQTIPLRAYLQLEARIFLGFGCVGFQFYLAGFKNSQKTSDKINPFSNTAVIQCTDDT